MKNLTLARKGISLIALLLLLELSFVGVLGYLLFEAEAAARYESKAQDVLFLVNKFVFYAVKTNYYENRFLGTGQRAYELSYRQVVPVLKETESTLIAHARAFPSLAKLADRVEDLFNRWFTIEERLVELQSTAQYAAAGALRHSPDRIREKEITTELDILKEACKPALEENKIATLRSRSLLMQGLWVCVVLNIVGAISIALAFMKAIASRLELLVDNTRKLAADKELNAISDRDDEIGRFDQFFHRMAADVREAARKERSLIDNSREVICSLSKQNRFEKVSVAAKHSWQFEPEYLIGREVTDLIPASERSSFLTALSRFDTNEPAVNVETRLEVRDGRLLDTVWSMHWSEADACFFCVVHDMSERKQAEEALKKSEARVRTILNSMLVGLMMVTEGGVIESANPRIEELLHYTEEELLGRTQSVIFPTAKFAGDLKQYVEESRHRAVRESGAIHLADVAARRRNGDLVPVEVWISEMETVQGHRYLVNLIDVTARHAIEQAKQEFVAMISHDLRTPLSSVRGFLELLEDGTYGDLSASGLDRAGMALRNVERLLRLINDLLEINKLESGQLELHRQMLPLTGIVQRAVESVHFFAGQHGVQVECGACDVSLFVDGDRLERVLVNLLSNAIKFSPRGQKVSVLAAVTEDSIEINVQDRGRGIPAAHRELIFERFKQVSTTDATQKGGTGLGLAICRAVVEQHGGTIGVNSEEGSGSTFWIKFAKSAVMPPAEPAATG